MSNRAVPTNITSMADVDFYREFDGAETSITVYNGDFSQADDLREQGYVAVNLVIVL